MRKKCEGGIYMKRIKYILSTNEFHFFIFSILVFASNPTVASQKKSTAKKGAGKSKVISQEPIVTPNIEQAQYFSQLRTYVAQMENKLSTLKIGGEITYKNIVFQRIKIAQNVLDAAQKIKYQSPKVDRLSKLIVEVSREVRTPVKDQTSIDLTFKKSEKMLKRSKLLAGTIAKNFAGGTLKEEEEIEEVDVNKLEPAYLSPLISKEERAERLAQKKYEEEQDRELKERRIKELLPVIASRFYDEVGEANVGLTGALAEIQKSGNDKDTLNLEALGREFFYFIFHLDLAAKLAPYIKEMRADLKDTSIEKVENAKKLLKSMKTRIKQIYTLGNTIIKEYEKIVPLKTSKTASSEKIQQRIKNLKDEFNSFFKNWQDLSAQLIKAGIFKKAPLFNY